MIKDTLKQRLPLFARKETLVTAALLAGVLGGAQAATADSPVSRSNGVDAPVVKGAGRQYWQVSDYTTVELVARERGAADNQQPWRADPLLLRQILQQVTLVNGKTNPPLFASGELDDVIPSLAEALAKARPDQDIAVVSSARHEDNSFLSLSAVTSRLFVADGKLNLIVHDARYDFYDRARGTNTAPHFTVGSRSTPGSVVLQSANAVNVRPDWLALSTAAPAPAAAPMAAPAPMPAPPAAVAPPPAPAPVVDPEKRLEMLKRLFDKGLITSDEYQKKREEILKGL